MASAKTTMLAIFLLITLSTPVLGLTDEQFLDIQDYVNFDIFTQGARNTIDIAQLIQGAFHDCTQGCDGSIDISDKPNVRLTRMVRRLERSYRDSPFICILSKGDYAVFVETMAVGKALKIASFQEDGAFRIAENTAVFKYGRAAHTGKFDEDDDEGPFQTGTENWNKLYATFKMCTKKCFWKR